MDFLKLERALFTFAKANIFPILLVLIASLVCVTNYTPGTWLTGWDTLHPEFDFTLNLKRVIFGVWREEQGLGAVAVHSHMADLPRILFMWLLSPAFPTAFLRYAYVFFCLIIGPLGIYYFLKEIIFKHANDEGHHRHYQLHAFLGGLFYLLNLGTIQHFYVPFEMFTTQYALIGWLFLYTTRIFRMVTRKDLLIFIGLLFAASPMAYAATLFYAFFLCLLVYCACFIFRNREYARIRFRRASLILLTTLLVNSYWLLPNIYTVLLHSTEVSQSKINSLFSEEAFLHNKAAGTLPNVLQLKGFLFNWSEYKGNGTFDFLLDEWRSFTSNPLIVAVEFLLVGIILVGVVAAIRRRHVAHTGLLAVAALSIVFLMNANPPFGLVFNFLRDHIPLFREALRTPYTKFSIPLMFCYAVFFALGTSFLLEAIHRRVRQKHFPAIFTCVMAALIVVSMLPAFAGGVISPSMRVKIPNEYFALNEWFSKQPDAGRIAHLPMSTFWAWTYYDWGYQGAGFVWFGIPQPLLDRDFDRWSRFNEQYYREMSHALYAQDKTLFESLLEKYRIQYFLYDEHVIVPERRQSDRALFPDEIKALLASSEKVKVAQTFGQKITVYKVQLASDAKPSAAITAAPQMIREPIDFAFSQYGHYLTPLDSNEKSTGGKETIFYLLRSFIGAGEQVKQNVVTVQKNNYTVTMSVPKEMGTLVLPDYAQLETFLPVDIYAKRGVQDVTIKVVYGLPWPQDYERPFTMLTLPLPQAIPPAVVSVNQAQPLALPEGITPDYVYAGRATLSTKADNTFSLFTPAIQALQGLELATLPLEPELCSKADERQVFGLDLRNAGETLVLYGQNAVACTSLPINSVLQDAQVSTTSQDPILMQFSFDYKLVNATSPYYCLYDTVNEQCVYTSYGNRLQLITSPNHFTDTVAVPANALSRYQLRLFLDTVNSKELQELHYQNLTFAFTQARSSTTLQASAIAQSLEQRQFQFNKGGNLALTGFFPEENRNFLNDITLTRRRPETCSGLAPTFFDREVVVENKRRAIAYVAENGTSCDHFGYPALQHDRSYLIAIDAKHKTGLPLKVCVSNAYTKRCELFTELGKRKEFNKHYLLLPSNVSPIAGYDINIDNVSIGSLRSANDLRSIQMLAFPANWLGNLRILPSSPPEQFPIKVAASHTGLPFIKSANVGGESTAQIVQIDQAYEPGWQLWRMIGPIPVPMRTEHVMVDNWANGFVLQPGGAQTVVAIFLPQLLQLFGFGLLVGFSAMVCVWRFFVRLR